MRGKIYIHANYSQQLDNILEENKDLNSRFKLIDLGVLKEYYKLTYWLKNKEEAYSYFMKMTQNHPEVLTIDEWNLEFTKTKTKLISKWES